MLGKKSTRDLVRPGGPDPGAVPEQKEKRAKEPRKPKEPRQSKEPGERKRLPLKDVVRSRTFLGGCCVAAALLLAFVAVPLLQAQISETVSVVVLTQNVGVGTEFTEDMLELKEMGVLNLPAGTLYDPREAVGRYAAVAALAGDLLTAGRLSDRFPTEDPGLLALPEGTLAMSATLANLAQSVSGKLRAGDVIQLYAVLENTVEASADYTAISVPELQCVEVLAVTNAEAADIVSGELVQDSGRQIATVTLAVTRRQAAVLAGLEQGASIHAALVTRGNAALKAEALAQQALLLQEEETIPNGLSQSIPPAASDTPEASTALAEGVAP